MKNESSNLGFLRRYFDAVARFASGEELAAFFAPGAVQEEYPNRFVPQGAVRDLAALQEAALRGAKVMTSQTFEILKCVEQGDAIALEVKWAGTLAVPVGSLPMGGVMRARFGVFLELRDGKILSQRNYDCFDPF
jgi:ketosteroid isomerase-like protein